MANIRHFLVQDDFKQWLSNCLKLTFRKYFMVLITEWEYLFLHKWSQISLVENSVKISVTFWPFWFQPACTERFSSYTLEGTCKVRCCLIFLEKKPINNNFRYVAFKLLTCPLLWHVQNYVCHVWYIFIQMLINLKLIIIVLYC